MIERSPHMLATSAAAPRRFDELEAYRGIAAICIIIFHTYQYSRQGLELPAYVYEGTPLHSLLIGLHMSAVFFTLSGFLLFLPFARAALAQDGQRSVRSFLIRRLIRVLPLYYLALLLIWAWRFVGHPGQLTDLLLHLSFTQTLHPTYIFWTIGPAWSLAVEVHFYLFLVGFGPLVYWLCGKLPTVGQRWRLLCGLLGVLALGSALFKWWAFTHPEIATINYFYSLPAKLDVLALGMLLALAVAARRDQPLFGPAVARLLQLAGLALIVGVVLLDTVSPLVQLYHSSLIGLGSVLLISSTTLGPRGSGWERTLQLPALRFVGLISYGLFLLHEPIMLELGRIGFLISPAPDAFPINALILIGLSMLAATTSYYLLEQPCNELRHLFDARGRLIERYSKGVPVATPRPAPRPSNQPASPKPATAQH